MNKLNISAIIFDPDCSYVYVSVMMEWESMYMDDSALNALNGDNSTLCREASARRNQEVCPLCALAELKHSNLALIPAVTHPSEQQTVKPGLLQHSIYSFIVFKVNKFSENYSKNVYIKISVILFF